MTAAAWLQFRQILAGRKAWVALLLLAMPALLSLLVVTAGEWRESDVELWAQAVYLFALYPQSTCLLLALLYGVSLVAAELDGKTLTYLFTRPVAKWRILVGKYLAVVGSLAFLSVLSLGASWVVLGAPGGLRFLLGQALAAAGAVVAYTAIFTLVGVLFRTRTLVIGIIYAVTVEFFLSFVPALVSAASVTYYLRSMVARTLDVEIPPEVLRVVGDMGLGPSALVVLGIAAGTLAVASWVCARREYVVADAV